MNRAVAALSLALVIQCGIVAAVFWPAGSRESATAATAFVPIDPATIDRVFIGDEYDNEAVLARTGTRWVIPALHGLPADTGRIESLLAELSSGNHGWPIAQSPTAQQRFQVSESNYQRRLTLAARDDNLVTLYLGTSPGFGKVHARNGDQHEIHSLELNNFDIPAIAGKWLDPRILQTRVPVRIDTDLYHLRFEDGAWLTGNGNTPDETSLLTLLTALKTIEVLGVADGDQARNLAEREADLIMRVESLAGTATLELMALDNRHFIHSSEYPLFFQISQLDYTRLVGIDIELIAAE